MHSSCAIPQTRSQGRPPVAACPPDYRFDDSQYYCNPSTGPESSLFLGRKGEAHPSARPLSLRRCSILHYRGPPDGPMPGPPSPKAILLPLAPVTTPWAFSEQMPQRHQPPPFTDKLSHADPTLGNMERGVYRLSRMAHLAGLSPSSPVVRLVARRSSRGGYYAAIDGETSDWNVIARRRGVRRTFCVPLSLLRYAHVLLG